MVTAGPVCPVEREPPASACADRPVPGATIVVRSADGRDVAAVTSGGDGSFAIELAPGTYQLVPQAVAGLLGTAPPQEVRLARGASATPVTITYDTGIR
jgi:Carboxypeptidase regulatory-like domain